MKEIEFANLKWEHRFVLTELPIEIDGVLYKAKAIPFTIDYPYILGLEKIEKKKLVSFGYVDE